MTYLVRLHIFSGRPDPVWAVSEPTARRILRAADTEPARLFAESATGGRPAATSARRGLGYRGISITRTGEDIPTDRLLDILLPEPRAEHVLIDDFQPLESRLLETGRRFLSPRILEAARRAIAKGTIRRKRAGGHCPPCTAAAAPAYDPAYWNDDETRLLSNNCYAYANDRATDTYAQPGLASGQQYSWIDCGDVAAAAVRDGLQVMPDFAGEIAGGYVALVIWPGHDYHWYRQDKNGCWSHKPGTWPARNHDENGTTITDPQICDRGDYSVFCTYMATSDAVVIA